MIEPKWQLSAYDVTNIKKEWWEGEEPWEIHSARIQAPRNYPFTEWNSDQQTDKVIHIEQRITWGALHEIPE